MIGARSSADLDGLLVALVLAPATYSRNRFFDLHRDADVRRVRRRAAAIRSIVRDLASPARVRELDTTRLESTQRGVELRYELADVGVRRTALLDALELALVRYAVDRARRRPEGMADVPPSSLGPPIPSDRDRIEQALARLRGLEH